MYTFAFALYLREVRRFTKLWLDTVLNPIASIILFLLVFYVVGAGRTINGINYTSFVYAGLLGMILVNGSFSNPGFALVIAKNLGNIIDLQLAPIKSWAIGLSYAFAALTRAVVTLIIALLITVWFIPQLSIHSVFYLFLSVFLTGFEFGMLGVIFGIKAKAFESLTLMTTFIMQPMIFLAGVFYPISALPYPWSFVSLFNPIFHNINLFRYSITGFQTFSPLTSLWIILAFCLLFFLIMFGIMDKGIKNVKLP